jgi:hypothetical protein
MNVDFNKSFVLFFLLVIKKVKLFIKDNELKITRSLIKNMSM